MKSSFLFYLFTNLPAKVRKKSELTKHQPTFFQLLTVILLEIYTEVEEEGVVVGGVIVVVEEVRRGKLIADLSINLIIFSTATELETHVVAFGTVTYIIAPILDFPLRTDGIGEIGAYEGKDGDMLVGLETVLDDQGNFEVIVSNIVISLLGTTLGIVKTRLEEYRS